MREPATTQAFIARTETLFGEWRRAENGEYVREDIVDRLWRRIAVPAAIGALVAGLAVGLALLVWHIGQAGGVW